VFPGSTTETVRVIWAGESFWSIVTPRSDGETVADDARQSGGTGDQGYPARHAKAKIIALVEGSHLPAKATLQKLGIPRATFYRWCDRYREGGPDALFVSALLRPIRVVTEWANGRRQHRKPSVGAV
jgi:hypothetical protein